MAGTQTARLLSYVRQHGMLRPRDLRALGIPREILKRLVDQEALMRLSRGIYVAADYEPTADTLRRASAALDKPVTILQDLQGPKIRVGQLAGGQMTLSRQAEVLLVPAAECTDGAGIVPIDYS